VVSRKWQQAENLLSATCDKDGETRGHTRRAFCGKRRKPPLGSSIGNRVPATCFQSLRTLRGVGGSLHRSHPPGFEYYSTKPMRIFKVGRKKPMSEKERKAWRADIIEKLMRHGVPFSQLIGITDHELWQKKNRVLPVGGPNGMERAIIKKHRLI